MRDHLGRPAERLIGPYGRLFVSNSDTGAVYRLTLGAGIRQLVPGGLVLPGGLALMDTGPGPDSLFVADLWSLGEYDARTGELREVDRQSRAGGTIIESWTVAPDDGDVIVTSWMSNAVQIWDPETNQQVEVFTDFKVPVNAIRFQDDLVVSELGTGSVAMEDAQTGARSVLATGLQVPTGLAADGGDLWVADWATGKPWKMWPAARPSARPRSRRRGWRGSSHARRRDHRREDSRRRRVRDGRLRLRGRAARVGVQRRGGQGQRHDLREHDVENVVYKLRPIS